MSEELLMSEWGTTQQAQQGSGPQAEGAPSNASAGSLLKAARESRGLHIAALAVSLKVPVKKIELLESDRFDELPDAVFVRALAASVCRALKVDATDILGKLPQTNVPRLSQVQQGINTPFRMPADGPGPNFLLAMLKRPVAWAVMALLVGAAVLIFIPDFSQKASDLGTEALAGLKSSTTISSTSDSPSNTTEGSTNGTVLGAGTAVTSSPEALSATGQPTLALSPAGSLSKLAVTSTLSTPKVTSPTLVISPSLENIASATASSDADGMVVFKATGQSWIEVSDARGKTTLRKMLQSGESVGASGALPLEVTVGSADQTQVWVRGKPFEGGKVRNNVRRFEVR
jgi:cytoskeleton protein RodZ